MSKMNTVNLYNNDGTLSARAQFLLSVNPPDIKRSEWMRMLRDFRSTLSSIDLKEFNRLKKNESTIRWRTAHPEKAKENNSNWRAQNPEKAKEISALWRVKHPDRAALCISKYHKQRRQKDPLYRFFQSIRSQAVRVVKQVGLGKKPTNTFKWVGCTPEQLKAHIESLFLEGMTWDNYGKYGWHVDHIRPVSSFKPEEWEQINHYTNLQPLWAEDNISKSNKY